MFRPAPKGSRALGPRSGPQPRTCYAGEGGEVKRWASSEWGRRGRGVKGEPAGAGWASAAGEGTGSGSFLLPPPSSPRTDARVPTPSR